MNANEFKLLDLISAVGQARSNYLEAIHEAKTGNYELCNELMRKGNDLYAQGHRLHSQLIQMEAEGKGIAFSALFTHAQDQMMSAECFKILCEEFIALYKKIDNLNTK